MLPSELLTATIRKGKIYPKFAKINQENLEIANELIEVFKKSIGKKREELSFKIDEIENMHRNIKFIRGLETLLFRRCEFKIDSEIDPSYIRKLVFEEAGREIPTTEESRKEILRKVAEKLKFSLEEVECCLFADLEQEQVLKSFDIIAPKDLLKLYNLSLTQTLLFKATDLEIYVKENFKQLFRKIKYLGLMYLCEKKDRKIIINVEGPLSLLKLTERYGVALARLLPHIIRAKEWKIRANIVRRYDIPRLFTFELDSKHSNLFPEYSFGEEYDSAVEERFALEFNALQTDWKLRREPEPLIVGNQVLIPDFSLEKGNIKVYMEIVGFWTPEYLQRKLKKLSQVRENIIISVDKNLACSKFREMRNANIIYYKTKVPIREVLSFLREFEKSCTEEELKSLYHRKINLDREVIKLEVLAREQNISMQTAKEYAKALKDFVLIGDELIAPEKIFKIRKKLETLPKEIEYAQVVRILNKEGITNVNQLLNYLGYEMVWKSLNPNSVVIRKKEGR